MLHLYRQITVSHNHQKNCSFKGQREIQQSKATIFKSTIIGLFVNIERTLCMLCSCSIVGIGKTKIDGALPLLWFLTCTLAEKYDYFQ
jgi:hypothetical protein